MSFHVEYQMGMFGVKAPRDNRLKFISGYDAVQLMDAMRDSKIMFHALIRCDSIECMDSRKTFKPITSDMLRELFENNAMHHVMTESAAHAPGFSREEEVNDENREWESMRPVGAEIGSDENSWDYTDERTIIMTDDFKVLVKKLSPDAELPIRKHADDAGADLHSNEDVVLHAGERRLIHSGISIAFPEGWLCWLTPRSGLAAKHGITIVNTPGLIDAGYRGEICAILLNTSDEDFIINKGDRIAQLVFQKCEQAVFIETNELPESVRGEGGFGSTGKE